MKISFIFSLISIIIILKFGLLKWFIGLLALDLLLGLIFVIQTILSLKERWQMVQYPEYEEYLKGTG